LLTSKKGYVVYVVMIAFFGCWVC